MASEDDSPVVKRKINELRVVDLRLELEQRGLDKTGIKAVLIEKLQKALEEEGHDIEEYEFEMPAEKKLSPVKRSLNSKKLEEDGDSTLDDDEKEEVDEKEENGEVKESEESDSSPVKKRKTTKPGIPTKAEQELNRGPYEGIDLNDDSLNLTIEEDEEKLLTEEDDNLLDKTFDSTADEDKAKEESSLEETDDGQKSGDKSLDQMDEKTEKSVSSQCKDGKNLQKDEKGDKKKGISGNGSSSSRNLWVSGLSSSTRATDLKQTFSKYGKVVGAKVVTNARTPGSRCYGYVTMFSSEEAAKCIQHLHRTELHGRMISVERAKGDSTGPPKKSDTTSKKQEEKKKEERKSGAPEEKKDKKEGEKPTETKPEEKRKEKDESRDRHKSKDRPKPITGSPGRKPRSASAGGVNRVLSFQQIKEERDRQKMREREREMREEDRRRREDTIRQRDIDRKQREEAVRLERERKHLRDERDRIERERAELMRLERERQRLEREKIEREKEELRRQKDLIKQEELRRAMKRPIEEKRPDPFYEDRKRLATESRYQVVSKREESTKPRYEEERRDYTKQRDFEVRASGGNDPYAKLHGFERERGARFEEHRGREQARERPDITLERYDRTGGRDHREGVRNGRPDERPSANADHSTRGGAPRDIRRGHAYDVKGFSGTKPSDTARRYGVGGESWNSGMGQQDHRSSVQAGKSGWGMTTPVGLPRTNLAMGAGILNPTNMYSGNQSGMSSSMGSIGPSFGGDRFDAYKQQVPLRRF